MKLSFTTVDVFTKTRYQGNPLALVHVPAYHDPLTQAQKQLIAREFNLSETVFLHEPTNTSSAADPNPIKIDIFTPDAELPFAGHPTIGSAWYLLSHLSRPVQSLLTKAGPIPISLSDSSLVRAKLPHNVHIHSHTVPSPLNDLANPIVSIVRGVSFILVHLPDLEALAKAEYTLHKDSYNASILDPGWQEGLIGTLYYVSQGAGTYRTRMHVNFEDPATGSASGALGAYLALHEPKEKGSGPFKYSLVQGVEMGKRSEIGVEVVRGEDGGVEEVCLSGTAVKVMEGSLEV